MDSELPFTGFNELIKKPLASKDESSFSLIQRCLLEEQHPPLKPFSVIIWKLTGRVLSNSEAMDCWKMILKHKSSLQEKLGRTISIQAAAIDYLDRIYHSSVLFNTTVSQPDRTPSTGSEHTESLFSQGYHLEKLKEELLRAKRYKHALSIVVIELDDFQTVRETLGDKDSDKMLATIVRIIKKSIRSVDFLYRLADERFFLILPNTNRREAIELAERIRARIHERTKRLNLISNGVTATLSVSQCSNTDFSIELVSRMERVLYQRGNKSNSVLSL